jgi:hypothetical protein
MIRPFTQHPNNQPRGPGITITPERGTKHKNKTTQAAPPPKKTKN